MPANATIEIQDSRNTQTITIEIIVFSSCFRLSSGFWKRSKWSFVTWQPTTVMPKKKIWFLIEKYCQEQGMDNLRGVSISLFPNIWVKARGRIRVCWLMIFETDLWCQLLSHVVIYWDHHQFSKITGFIQPNVNNSCIIYYLKTDSIRFSIVMVSVRILHVEYSLLGS